MVGPVPKPKVAHYNTPGRNNRKHDISERDAALRSKPGIPIVLIMRLKPISHSQDSCHAQH